MIEAMKLVRDAIEQGVDLNLIGAKHILDQAIAEVEKQEPVAYTTGHCKEKAQPNGCQLHNLHCGYPACDRKAVVTPQPKREPPTPREVKDTLRATGLLTNSQAWDVAEEVMKLLANHGIKENT